MKKYLLACGLAVVSPLALAVDISVGGTVLAIPAPPEFAPVADDMKPFADYAKRFVPATNEQFALFLPAGDTALAAKGGMPVSQRKFYVQTARSIIAPTIGQADFEELKTAIKTQNATIIKEVETEFPGMLDKMNKGISDDFHVDLKLSGTKMIPFPAHDESDRSLAYSMIVRFNAAGPDGKPVPYEAVVTATFVHLKGKVLFLYVNAEKSGLEWSRSASRTWATAVIAANPSSPDDAAREAVPAQSGFHWDGVLRSAVIGAIVGGLVGLVLHFIRKKKS